MRTTTSGTAVTVGLGVLLGASALSKLLHMGVFQAVVALSGLVPGPVVPALAWGLTITEAAVSLALIGGGRLPTVRFRALWVAAFLVTTFLTYDLTRLAFGITLPGPYFGLWCLMSPTQEAMVAVGVLAVVVWLLSRPIDAGPQVVASRAAAADGS